MIHPERTALVTGGNRGLGEAIAALVAFIASDAAAFMAGSDISMNGGQHMY